MLDGQGQVIASSAASDPLHPGDLVLRVAGKPQGQYFFRVEAADGTFAVGAYRLEVNPDNPSALAASTIPSPGPYENVAFGKLPVTPAHVPPPPGSGLRSP